MAVPEDASPSTSSAESPVRQYLRVRPTETALDPETVESHFQRLHRLTQENPESWYERLLGKTSVTTVEWLLVAPGDQDSGIDCYVGVDDESALDALERLCRGLFPNGYEFEQVSWHPDQVLDESAHNADNQDETPPYAAVEYVGEAERREDWQTQLTPFETFEHEDETRLPLAAIVEALADCEVPAVYQALCRPYPDWSDSAADRQYRLEAGRDTPAQRIVDDWFGDQTGSAESTNDGHTSSRVTELDTKDPRRSFVVTARAVTAGEPASSTLTALASALETTSHTCYSVHGRKRTGTDAANVHDALVNRTVHSPSYDRLTTKLPWTANRSRGIVADPSEAPAFCLLDGTALTAAGDRAIAPTPGERTSLPRPPESILDRYRGDGLALGAPLDQDSRSREQLVLPPSLQSLHVAWFGKTGSGKSTSLTNAILANQAATDGADILIDPKGDRMVETYLRAHYAEYGNLEDVYYFDCTETLPAVSFFDIRDQLADGIDRTTAVEDITDHYIEILVGIMGRDRFEQAVRSPDIIRYLCKSLFDPVHGSDAFSHRDLQQAVSQLHETRDPPPVVDHDLQAMLNGVAANSKRSFDELMQGVSNRIEKVPLDARLAELFNHIPGDDDPHFDLRTLLDEDAVVIIDTGGLRPESRRVITLVMLSTLWTALQRRRRQADADADLPLVNLYLEEAAELADSGLLAELLAQSRSFGLSMTLAMQFPAQLAEADPEAYAELLNNVSTIVTGNVSVDSRLAERLATDDMSTTAVSNRLRSLQRGQWFVDLPAAFGNPEPRPFLLESLPLPPGHPESSHSLSGPRETAFTAAHEVVQERSRLEYGLDLRNSSGHTTTDSTGAANTETEDSPQLGRVDSALPYTQRLPKPVKYDDRAHSLVCETCETRHDPTSTGMRNAIVCCHSRADVDRESIPICELSLKLTDNELRQSPYTPAQLRFLQAVYSAHQQRFDSTLEYDLLRDSMIRLQEYVGIDQEEVQELVDADLLRVDCTYPHKLYTVSPDGRDAINVQHREGIAHGAGEGDLSESSLHVAMVELGRRYIEQAFVDDPESAAAETVVYHEHDELEGRLDAAGLDRNGDIVVTLEAERSNHDTLRAVPDDYDKMAACDPEAAIWLVKNRDGAHGVLDALHDPAEGEPRIEKTYTQTTSPSVFTIDQPGFTEMNTMQSVQGSVLDE